MSAEQPKFPVTPHASILRTTRVGLPSGQRNTRSSARLLPQSSNAWLRSTLFEHRVMEPALAAMRYGTGLQKRDPRMLETALAAPEAQEPDGVSELRRHVRSLGHLTGQELEIVMTSDEGDPVIAELLRAGVRPPDQQAQPPQAPPTIEGEL